MSEVLVDGRRRLIVEPDDQISVGPAFKVVWVAELKLIMIDRENGVVFVPEGSQVQMYGEVEPPIPPPPMPPIEGSVIDAKQGGGT